MPDDVNPPSGNVTPEPTGGTPAASTGDVKPATPSPEVPGAASAPKDVKPPEGTVPIQALHEERSKRQALESELENIRNQYQYQQPQIQQPQPPPLNPVQQDLEQLWDSDPRKAVQAEIMYAMEWRDKMDASIDFQSDALAKKYPDFNNYRSSAQAYVRAMPINERAKPGVLESAYFLVKGQNTDALIEQQKAELYRQFQAGQIQVQGVATPPGATSTPQQPAGQQVALTQEQINVANAMGLTPEAYASAMVGKK